MTLYGILGALAFALFYWLVLSEVANRLQAVGQLLQ